jgi:acyl transferase domain-containing protein
MRQDQLRKGPGDEAILINTAELGPSITTALQIALFLQFQRLGITPATAIGHSTGEAAAAFAAGYLSLREAVVIAYYYGYVTRHLKNGGMAAVSLSKDEVRGFLEEGVVVACENSPSSTTLSGDWPALERVLESINLAHPAIKPSRLHVDVAYHSRKYYICV